MAGIEVVTLIAPNGMQVSVAESKRASRLATGYRLPGGARVESSAGAYDGMKVHDLKSEIDKRNASRGDDAQMISTDGNKAELVAALVADDAAVN